MATYKEIQTYVREVNGYSAKSCWIAHMKEVCGLNPKVSARGYSVHERVHPCPRDKQKDIKGAFRHFGMI